jgi:tetratricopeptide (TPR) repeat protein
MTNYETAVAKDAKNSLGYSRIGALWYAARNYSDALTNYGKAKEADPNNPLPYNDLANAYYYVGKFDLARQNIEKYLELSDQSCDDKIRYANILFLAKDYAQAISRMQEVMGTCGEKPYMYRVLGYSQYETKDYQNALTNMKTLFAKSEPGKIIPKDYKYMAQIYGALRELDSTNFYVAKRQSADTSSNKKPGYIEDAEIYKSINTEAAFVKSAQYYKMAIDADPGAATATDYFYWGLMEYYGKRYPEAAKAFEQMEAKYPDQPSGTYWRARVAAAEDNEGKTGAAEPHFKKWLAIPDNEAYKHKPADLNMAYQYLAIVAYNKNDKAATREYIAKIKSIDPQNALAAQLESLMSKPAANSKPAPKK